MSDQTTKFLDHNYEEHVPYSLGSADKTPEYDSATLTLTPDDPEVSYTDPHFSLKGSKRQEPKAPTLPPRRSIMQSKPPEESPYHYEVPDPTLAETNLALPYCTADAIMIDDIEDNEFNWTPVKVLALVLGVLALSFCGGIAGGAVIGPAEVSSRCACANGSVAFFLNAPTHGTCWHIADGVDAPINMLVRGGLYIRSGAADSAGTVLDESTSASNFSVVTHATMLPEDGFAGVIGTHNTSVETPEFFRLSAQTIKASHGSVRGWEVQPHVQATSDIESSGTETRPVSIVLIPAMCIHPA